MQRLRRLNTLGVGCALLCASSFLTAQNGYACSWRVELFDYTTQETPHFPMDATPVKIPLVRADKGMEVHCSLDQSEMISIGILKQQKVDILCRYPDDQMITARAITIFDIFTGDTIPHPVILFFSTAHTYNETLYRLYVDCR